MSHALVFDTTSNKKRRPWPLKVKYKKMEEWKCLSDSALLYSVPSLPHCIPHSSTISYSPPTLTLSAPLCCTLAYSTPLYLIFSPLHHTLLYVLCPTSSYPIELFHTSDTRRFARHIYVPDPKDTLPLDPHPNRLRFSCTWASITEMGWDDTYLGANPEENWYMNKRTFSWIRAKRGSQWRYCTSSSNNLCNYKLTARSVFTIT